MHVVLKGFSQDVLLSFATGGRAEECTESLLSADGIKWTVPDTWLASERYT